MLRKEYLEEEVINKFNQPTACSVWPNFSHPSWDRYYLYLASNLPSSISVNHTFSLQSLNNLIDQQETDKEIRYFFSSQW